MDRGGLGEASRGALWLAALCRLGRRRQRARVSESCGRWAKAKPKAKPPPPDTLRQGRAPRMMGRKAEAGLLGGALLVAARAGRASSLPAQPSCERMPSQVAIRELNFILLHNIIADVMHGEAASHSLHPRHARAHTSPCLPPSLPLCAFALANDAGKVFL